ncbi:MAG: folylpolyglutamate synthase/dihydrofolate synthase family protein [Bryobacteraceae bacterium]
MTYPESVQFLYALGNEVKTIKLGLDRIRIVLEALGNPQRAYRIIHVAGTNGKGSVCAMIDAGLRAAGIYSGMFTSPHLIEPTERIQIDGMPVSREEFEQAFNAVHEAAAKLDLDTHPTYFETVTAMALWLFRERGVETAVIEVGLGGRLDATNIVEPALTVITPIDYDHQIYLGNTLEKIAGEKAGILKSGIPAIFAKQRPEAARVLDARAKELGIPVTQAEQFEIRDLVLDARGSNFSGLVCPLAGEHQVDNAVTAAQALMALGVAPQGIEEARWPGRIEHVTPNPDTILDGAHNPAGAQALAKYLRRFYGNRKVWMIFGAMRDKDVKEVTEILFPVANELVFTAPIAPGNRALEPEKLRELAGKGHVEPTIAAAIDYVFKNLTAEDVVVITGSLYLVGEARALFLTTTLGRW